MTKYGFRNNDLKVKEVTADSVVTTALEFEGTTISTAAAGTAAYIPVTIDSVTYYILATTP